MMWGAHCFKSWASTQATVALSSAEAELYALTKGVSQALGVMTLLEDFSLRTRSVLHTDASAAIGIVRRAGLGKLRHLNVRYFWLQDHLRGGQMDLHKVAGVANAADLVTKHLGPGKAKDHLEAIGVSLEGGRAANPPTLNQAAELGRWRGSGGGSGGSGGGGGAEGSGGQWLLSAHLVGAGRGQRAGPRSYYREAEQALDRELAAGEAVGSYFAERYRWT